MPRTEASQTCDWCNVRMTDVRGERVRVTLWDNNTGTGNYSYGRLHPRCWEEIKRVGRLLYPRPDEVRALQGPAYTCPLCGRTTYHPQDVENAYCPCCGNDSLPKHCEHAP